MRSCLAERICSDACTLFTHAGCPSGTKCDLLAAGSFLFEPEITICSAIGTGGAGTPCTRNAQCRRNFVCLIDEDESGTCTAVCDDTHPCTTGTCSGLSGMAGYCM